MGDVLRLRNAALVGSVLTEPPEGADAQLRRTYEATARVIDAYAPSLIKKGREAARAETQHVVDAAAKAAAAIARDEHAKALQAMANMTADQMRHVRGSSFWRGVGTMAVVTVLLCGATGYGVSWFITESQMNAVAITQAATRPSAERMRDSMAAPDPSESGFR